VPLPKLDLRLLPSALPSVITAHDILPRRWAGEPELWERVYARFDRVVAHSEDGSARLSGELDVAPQKITVIPHPVFPGPIRHEDDGRTLLALGVIRPYKQIDHVITAAQETGCRLLVVGDPTYDLGERVDLPDTQWRLGYRPHAEVDQALAEATLAVFTYRNELDQSGALLRALGAGVPTVAYDVGGVAEPVRRFDAGAVVPPDDQDALAAAICGLLDDGGRLAAARAGAMRARSELTWQVCARQHIDLYESLLSQ
jgi:glycosyltransferase involved in cell wall biosynthesis